MKWYWDPAVSDSVDSIVDVEPLVSWSNPTANLSELADHRAPGKRPFIVPPTASKSGYFSNELIRRIWYLSRRELARASRICVLGYSLPLTDLLVSSLLSSFADGKTIVVVNPDGQVADRFESMLPNGSIDRRFAGREDPIPAFVEWYCSTDQDDGQHH